MNTRTSQVVVLTVFSLLLLDQGVSGEAGSDQLTRQMVLDRRRAIEHPFASEQIDRSRSPWPLVRGQMALSSAFSSRLQAPRAVAPLLEDTHPLPFYAACRALSEVASEDCLEGLVRAQEHLHSFPERWRDRLKLQTVIVSGGFRTMGGGGGTRTLEEVRQWQSRFRGMEMPWRVGVTEWHDLWGALVLLDNEPVAGEPFRCLAYWSVGAPLGVNPLADWTRKDLPHETPPGLPTAEQASKWVPYLSWQRLDNLFLPEESGEPWPRSELKVVGSSMLPTSPANARYIAIALEGEKAPVLPGWYLVELRFGRLETHTTGASQVMDMLPVLVYVRAGEALAREIAERVATLGAMEELSEQEITEHLERLRELRPGGVTQPLLKVLDYANQRDEQGQPKNISARNLLLLCEVLALTGDPKVVKPLFSLEPFKEYGDEDLMPGVVDPSVALRLVGLPAVRELSLLLGEQNLSPEKRHLATATLLELDRPLGMSRLLQELEKAGSPDDALRLVYLFPRGRELRAWAPSLPSLCQLYGDRGTPWERVIERLVSLLAEADAERAIGFLEKFELPLATLKLAKAYLDTGKLDAVLALAEPSFPEPSQQLSFMQCQAEAAYRLEKYELAADLFSKCAELPQARNGDVMVASYRRAQCLEKLGEAKGALALLESLKLDDESRVWSGPPGVVVDGSMVQKLMGELREKTEGELPLVWRAQGSRVLGPAEGDKVLVLKTSLMADAVQGDIAELDLKTGFLRTVFRLPVRERPYASALCGDMLAFASDLGVILGVSTRTWDVRWRLPIALGNAGQLIAGPDYFLVREEGGRSTVIDAATGQVRWQKTVYGRSGFPGASAQGERLFYWGPTGQLNYLEASTGRQVGAFPVWGSESEPVFARGRMYVVARLHTVVCLSPEDGKEYWRTPITEWQWSGKLQASEDGLWLSQPGAVLLLLDLETGAVKLTVSVGADEAGSQEFPLFAADAESLACLVVGRLGGDPKLTLFDPATGDRLGERALGYSLAGNTRPLLWHDLIIVPDSGRTSAYRCLPRGNP